MHRYVICFENLMEASDYFCSLYVVNGRRYQSDFSPKVTLCSVKLSKIEVFQLLSKHS